MKFIRIGNHTISMNAILFIDWNSGFNYIEIVTANGTIVMPRKSEASRLLREYLEPETSTVATAEQCMPTPTDEDIPF